MGEDMQGLCMGMDYSRKRWGKWAAMNSRYAAPLRQGDRTSPRVVCISLHLPDPEPDNAGVKYLNQLAKELGDDVFVVAPDAPMNRRASTTPGVGRHRLIPVASDHPTRIRARLGAFVHRTLPTTPPAGFLKAALRDPDIVSMLAQAEIVDLQWPGMTSLARRIRRSAPNAHVVATPHDVPSQALGRRLRATRSLRGRVRLLCGVSHARAIERFSLPKADTVVVFSEKDRRLLPNRARVTVIDPPISAPAERRQPEGLPAVTVVGPLSRPENWDGVRWLVSQVWPAVRAAVPHARLVVAGKVSESQRKLLSTFQGVDVRGFVADIDGLYDQTTVVAAPLRLGAGIKFKVLDALVRGIPLVTTSVGAEGIGDADFTPSSTDDPAEFSARLVQALQKSEPSVRTAEAGRRWAQEKYSLRSFKRSVARVYGPNSSPSSDVPDIDLVASVVIPVRNGEATLGRALEALARQSEAAHLEVIVSDNGSVDQTRRVARLHREAFASLRVVDSGDRAGVSHARNVGILHARCDKILICDADDEVRGDWAQHLIAALDSADVVGGRAISSVVSGHSALEREQDHAPAARTVLGYLPYVLGGCMGVRRAAAISVGGFDETFMRGHEEVDFCWRLQQAGYTLHGVQEAMLDYHQRDRARDAARQRFHSNRTRILLWVRHSAHGELAPISLKGSLRDLARSLSSGWRLIKPSTRFSAARDIGWAFGAVDGHLRYRFLSAPAPAELPLKDQP
ncbi:glycosyltransferase [Microbacterium esteraromaticum]|uniref:glycosyltransferase n=1 Tax=Microbacterium esteraromaticum TaxID=57043 RepID=UPI00236792DB|nr:glycosyltransferase [Microbacterium esteraromaticum]WDH79455.1 glycosyltransferase [Microbacterium esteraromaticum]